MNTLREKLTRLGQVLENKNPQLVGHLNGPAKNIPNFFRQYSLNINEGDHLHSLYEWHDGTKINDEEHCLTFTLFPDFIFTSIEDIQKIISTDRYFNFASRKMIPIFSSCGGDFLTIKIEEYNISPQNACIYFCSPRVATEDNIIGMYDNLAIMIECILISYEKSFYFLNPEDNLIDRDINNIYNLSEKLNPKSDYWTSDLIM